MFLTEADSGVERQELRKTNELISRPIVRGQFSYLGRKLYNCMILHAQKARVPGQNAPNDSDAYKKLFWAPLSEIARDARYDSNDTEALKEVARQLMDIQVETETQTEWTADHIIEKVMIVNPAGLRKKGGRLWLGFRFPDEVMHLVTDPARYTRLPIHFLTQLRSGAAVALYECVKESAWKSSGLTPKRPWEDWQATLEGKPREELQGWKSEYKYFKNRVVEKAIAEINTLDVEVELIEYKTGRKVTDIQFHVRKKAQAPLEFPPPPIIDTTLIDAIMAFGIPKRESEDLLATNDEQLLRFTCEYVHKRLSDRNLVEVKSAAAYFRKALAGRYAESVKQKAPAPKLALPSIPTNQEADVEKAEKRKIITQRIEAMSEGEINDLFEELYSTSTNPAIRVITKNKSAKLARVTLVNWMLETDR